MGNSKSSRFPSSSGSQALFIQHHQKHCKLLPQSLTEIDLNKRVIFVSIVGLYKSYKQCPSAILYSSIILLPLKRDWVLKPSKKHHKIHNFSEMLRDKHFIELLKWKDNQQLAFWMMDEVDINYKKKSTKVKPFWFYFSDKLSNLYNTATSTKYNPLKLDINWWNDLNNFNINKSKYNMNAECVINELINLNMKYRPIQEILYDSNPSLNITIIYKSSPTINTPKDISVNSQKWKILDNSNQSIDDVYWIADDYDDFNEIDNANYNPLIQEILNEYKSDTSSGWLDC